MSIHWKRKRKILTGIIGLVVLIVAVVLVFTFVSLPGGGTLFGFVY
jgi:ABC-type transporter Mla subunit MlaD